MRILLVEDDRLLGDGLREGLIDAGFTVDWLTDGEAARAALQGPDCFDAMVLDLGLPRLDGLALLRWLREKSKALPVLVLTARDAVDDRVKGLDSGADDYLTKPFALREVAARLRALLRRPAHDAGDWLRWGDIVLDPVHQSAARAGIDLRLTAREYQLLWLLMRSFPHRVSRGQFEERLYGWEQSGDNSSLEVHLSNLRKKLGPGAIDNVRGMGWRLADIS